VLIDQAIYPCDAAPGSGSTSQKLRQHTHRDPRCFWYKFPTKRKSRHFAGTRIQFNLTVALYRYWSARVSMGLPRSIAQAGSQAASAEIIDVATGSTVLAYPALPTSSPFAAQRRSQSVASHATNRSGR
jgi:hypothetical protein